MASKLRRRSQKGGWQVIRGRRRLNEVVRENKASFIILCVTLLIAAAASYLYFLGPLAVLRYKAAGLTAIREGDYGLASASLEKADKLSYSRQIDILYPLGVLYFSEMRYAESAEIFIEILKLSGSEMTYGSETKDIGPGETSNSKHWPVEYRDISTDAYFQEPSLKNIYRFLAESHAYRGALSEAYETAARGFAETGDAELDLLAQNLELKPPRSLTSGGVYNGRFTFRFESAPIGVRTFYTVNDKIAISDTDTVIEYRDGIEIGYGEFDIKAICVNRYGLASGETNYIFTVLDAAGNLNGNIVNGAIAVARGDEAFFFNGSAIYKEVKGAAGVQAVKIVEGARIGCLNLLGEWLYFSKTDGVSNGAYKVRVDGTGVTRLTDVAVEYLQTAGDRIYFTTGEGLCSMSTEGGEITPLVKGNVSCVNYEDGNLYFIMESPDGDIDDAGPIYRFDIDGGELRKLVNGPASFLQLYDSRLYYAPAVQNAGAGASSYSVHYQNAVLARIATIEGVISDQITRPEAATDNFNVNEGVRTPDILFDISGTRNGFLIDDGKIYYFDRYERKLRVMDIGQDDSVAGRDASRAIAAVDKLDGLNVAAGRIYGVVSRDLAGKYIRVSQDFDASLFDGDDYYPLLENISDYGTNVGVRRYGNKLYYVEKSPDGTQAIYNIDTTANVNAPVAVELRANVAQAGLTGKNAEPADVGSTAGGAESTATSTNGAETSTVSTNGVETTTVSTNGIATTAVSVNSIETTVASVNGVVTSAGEPDKIDSAVMSVSAESADFSPVGKAILTGIPKNESIVFACEAFVITSDYFDARVYRLPKNTEKVPHVFGSKAEDELIGANTGSNAAANNTEPNSNNSESTADNPEAAANAENAANENEAEGNPPEGEGTAAVNADESTAVVSADESTEATAAVSEMPAVGESSDIDPAETDVPTDVGDGAVLPGSSELPVTAIKPDILADNGLHLWHGLSQIQLYENRLYFVSQAGFFGADADFASAAFICGDGPEIGEPFKVSGGRVFYKRGVTSGENGLYALDLESGAQRRLFGGDALDFDVDVDTVFYIDAADGFVYSRPIGGDEPDDRHPDYDGFACDAVICREGGGLIMRSPPNGYRLYALGKGGGDIVSLTESGAGSLAYYRDFIYYMPFDMPERIVRLDVSR